MTPANVTVGANPLDNATEDVIVIEPSSRADAASIWGTGRVKHSEREIAASTEMAANDVEGLAPIERVYPHVFDEDDIAGQARILILRARNDAQLALDAFGEADLTEVSSRLALIAALMARAHGLIDSNESLGGVVSFVRRAALAASSADIQRSALNALVKVLHSLSANPVIDLDDAYDLTETLTEEGWNGTHRDAEAFVAALLDETEGETEPQGALFPEAVQQQVTE